MRAAAGRDQPFARQFLDHRIDRGALDPEQAGEGLLGQLDPVAGAVLGVEQPARRALGDRVEGVAGDRLHHLRKEVIGEAAEQVADEARMALGIFERVHRDSERLAADQAHRARKGRREAAADDPADRAFAADRGDLDGAPAASSTAIEIIVSPTGKTLKRTCSPRVRTMSPGVELDQLAVRPRSAARASALKVASRLLPAKAGSTAIARIHFAVHARPRLTAFRHRQRSRNAQSSAAINGI